MLKKTIYIILGSIFLYSCNPNTETEKAIGILALEEYLLTSTEYYPLDNLPYLETIKKQAINSKCKLNIDSIKNNFYILNNYNSKDISNYKIRSIYLDVLISCYSADERTVNLIKLDKASDWTNELLNQYYNLVSNAIVYQTVNISEIKGLPFVIKNIKSVEELKNIGKDSNSSNSLKYLKISPVFKIDKYFYVEIINGCTQRGENKTLYIFRAFKNKFIIDNKIKTDYKY